MHRSRSSLASASLSGSRRRPVRKRSSSTSSRGLAASRLPDPDEVVGGDHSRPRSSPRSSPRNAPRWVTTMTRISWAASSARRPGWPRHRALSRYTSSRMEDRAGGGLVSGGSFASELGEGVERVVRHESRLETARARFVTGKTTSPSLPWTLHRDDRSDGSTSRVCPRCAHRTALLHEGGRVSGREGGDLRCTANRLRIWTTMVPDAYRALARYNRWLNEKIYAVAATLDDAERTRDRGAFFKSIHGTLNHLLVADRIWRPSRRRGLGGDARPRGIRSLDPGALRGLR